MADFIRLSSFLIFIIIISTLFVSSNAAASHSSHSVNNQRSADRDYKYAWFTRSIDDHDEQLLKNNLRQQLLATLYARQFGFNRNDFETPEE